MKELLRKAFEAGKDKQWDIEWQMGRSKPNFEEWYKEHEKQALSIANVVGRSEQLKAFQKMVNETKGYTAISDELIDKHLKSL